MPGENARTDAPPAKCQACDAEMQTPVACQSCHALYPPSSEMDHFQLFGLPVRFKIDLNELHRKYLALSRSVHPDFFGGGSQELNDLAVRTSAEVNEAYQRLKNPRTRAEYLLEMAGGKSSAQDKTVPQALLGEVFLIQEEIEAARAGGDESGLSAIRQRLQARLEAMTEEAGRSLDALLDDPDADKRDELRKHLNGMRYIEHTLQKL